MDALKDKERLVYQMFLIIEQSASGGGEVIDESDIWRSFMEICNDRCGTDFKSADAARIATNRIREAIPLERLEQLYEEATGRELRLEQPHHYDRDLRDKSPEEVKRSRPVELHRSEEQVDDQDELTDWLSDAEKEWAEDLQRQTQICSDKKRCGRFSVR